MSQEQDQYPQNDVVDGELIDAPASPVDDGADASEDAPEIEGELVAGADDPDDADDYDARAHTETDGDTDGDTDSDADSASEGEHAGVMVLDTWQIQLPATGDAKVDAALARLMDVEGLPPSEHADVYEAVHAGLQDALADLDRT